MHPRSDWQHCEEVHRAGGGGERADGKKHDQVWRRALGAVQLSWTGHQDLFEAIFQLLLSKLQT